jgi:endonuclease/exonuclease/phosphatase family metal-dependent hydrolase
MLRVVQFNLLGSLWVSDLYQLLPCHADFVDPDRVAHTVDYLQSNLPGADIYCLSEVTLESLACLFGAFPGYSGYFVPNDKDYWSQWLAEHLTETVPNGVAILTSNSRIQVTKRQNFAYGNGGHAAIVDGYLQPDYLQHSRHNSPSQHQQTLRIVSLHLDVTQEGDRESISKLIEYLHTLPATDLSIVSGDLNSTDVSAFTNAGYRSTVIDPNINTTPLMTGAAGQIDHTLVISSDNYRVEGIVSRIPNYQSNIVRRYCDTVKFNGSDHYATTSFLMPL